MTRRRAPSLVAFVALALLTMASSFAPPAMAGASCTVTDAARVGRYFGSDTAGGGRHCYTFTAFTGDVIVGTLARRGGDAGTGVLAHLYDPAGQEFAFFLDHFDGDAYPRSYAECTALSGGTWTLQVSVGGAVPDAASWDVSLDTSTQILNFHNGPYAPADDAPGAVLFGGASPLECNPL